MSHLLCNLPTLHPGCHLQSLAQGQAAMPHTGRSQLQDLCSIRQAASQGQACLGKGQQGHFFLSKPKALPWGQWLPNATGNVIFHLEEDFGSNSLRSFSTSSFKGEARRVLGEKGLT